MAEEDVLPAPLVADDTAERQATAYAAQPRAALTQEQCQTEVLALVNVERAKVGASPLVLDAGLNSISLMWSNWMAATGDFVHLPTKYSENRVGWNFWNATGNIPG